MKEISVIVLCLVCNVCHAGFLKGNELKEHCFKNGSYHMGICSGFVMGVFDGVFLSEKTWTAGKHSICPPKKVTSGQLREIVVKYLDEQTEDLQKDASELVWDALIVAYPCKQ